MNDDETEDAIDDIEADRPGDLVAVLDWLDLRYGIEDAEDLRERAALCDLSQREACSILLRVWDLAEQYAPEGEEL